MNFNFTSITVMIQCRVPLILCFNQSYSMVHISPTHSQFKDFDEARVHLGLVHKWLYMGSSEMTKSAMKNLLDKQYSFMVDIQYSFMVLFALAMYPI